MNITVQQSSHLQINQFVEEATKTGSLLSTPKRLLNQESWRFWSCPMSTPIGTCWLSFLMGKPSQKTFPRDLKVWTLQVSEPMPMSRPLELTSSSTNLKLKFKRDIKEQIEQLGVMDLKQMLSIWFFPISSSLSTTSSSRPPCLPTKWSIEECRSFPKLSYFQSGARNCKSLDVHNPPAFVDESDVVRDFNSCS